MNKFRCAGRVSLPSVLAVILAVTAAGSTGCGSDEQFTYSCTYTASYYCNEDKGDSVELDVANQSCKASSGFVSAGTFAQEACSLTNAVGKCTFTSDADQIYVYYTGHSDPSGSCAGTSINGVSGTYTAL